jgi:hypothetical protein
MTIIGTAASGTRAGMTNILTRWRRMVNDAAGSVWTDAQALTLLDSFRTDIYEGGLVAAPQNQSGTTVYKVHMSPWENLEESSSGTAAFRLYDANGSAISSGWSADYQRGLFTFTADQKGSARYIDARSYDLNAAAADGWRELMAAKASLYRFTADGATYDRQQWFEHCKAMALYYDSLSKPTYTTLERSDLC